MSSPSEECFEVANRLSVSGCSMAIRSRPNPYHVAANVPPNGTTTTAVTRRMFTPHSSAANSVDQKHVPSGGRSSELKHVTVERFRVRSVAGLRRLSGSRRWWTRDHSNGRNASLDQQHQQQRETLRIPFVTFPRSEEPCLRRTRLRLCQQRLCATTSPTSGGSGHSDQNNPPPAPPPPASYGELIPERYHQLRDAKTYTELRRILDRNGKYLSGQGHRNKADGTRDTDGSTGGQRARRLGKISLGQEDEGLGRVEGVARRFANYYHREGIQWHLDYLDACIERGEEVKQRFIEKQCLNGQGRKSRVTPVFSSVFKVHQPTSEVLDQLVCRKRRVFRSTIMDSFPSKLNHEKSEKLQNLIDNLYQLKLEGADLENDEALPKIILTECSSSDPRSDASKLAQKNNANSLKLSTDQVGDNRLNNNGCFLQPHTNSLGVPASSNYESEARPP
ncbi:hypothetical protein CpipJ_CPIJ013816 [Culex quinquefasciatus]|uniref:Uncharacterized protein n=1 Tax=Culex quinquefasciatus TaxID=7176 RepID=B0X2X6_CULQU|nr:hypothetical protein CpipJ_CPIJ013816 [Culex quinquefasciatus]|eukprot:XP_001863998.1 hypothetical protein CpipJ_CPIJ013816 [Culex quinquefasciatus]